MDVAVDEGGFADALGAEDDDFGFEGGGHCGRGVGGDVGSGVVRFVVVVVVVRGASQRGGVEGVRCSLVRLRCMREGDVVVDSVRVVLLMLVVVVVYKLLVEQKCMKPECRVSSVVCPVAVI